jgi:hypothetical protein
MGIDFAIITAERETPTIYKSVESLRRVGYSGFIPIIAEPNANYEAIDGTNYLFNKTTLGCFKNFDRALKYLIKNSDAKYICVLSDDFLYTKDLFKNLSKILHNDNLGYAALFTPEHMRNQPCNVRKFGWNKVNLGWGTSWGGLYVFKKDTAKEIIKWEFYQNHLENYSLNQQIDHCVPEVCFQMGLDQWYHNPSLADHIGYNSTIGHEHTKLSRGLRFTP